MTHETFAAHKTTKSKVRDYIATFIKFRCRERAENTELLGNTKKKAKVRREADEREHPCNVSGRQHVDWCLIYGSYVLNMQNRLTV